MIIKFNDFIKNSDSQLNTKAFIFYGENIGKIDNCTESLILSKKKKYENIEVIRKFTDELNHNELIPLVRQNSNPGLFGDQTIFILNIFNEKISKDIIFCIENHNFENLALIIRAEQLEARSTLRKYFEKKENLTIVPCYEETKFEKLSLIKDFCEREKIYFSEETKKELADSLSNQRIEILNDLNKIFFLTQHSNENFKLRGIGFKSCTFRRFKIYEFYYFGKNKWF